MQAQSNIKMMSQNLSALTIPRQTMLILMIFSGDGDVMVMKFWTCYDDWLDWFLEGDVKVCLKGSVGRLELHLLSGIASYLQKFHRNAAAI